MSLDLENEYSGIKDKINSYKTTVDLKKSELESKRKSLGDSFEQKKSDSVKQLNDLGDKAQRLQNKIKTQFDEIFDMVKISMPSLPTSESSTINLLLETVLTSAQNTKSRIGEIFLTETISTVGCSEEQTFDPDAPLYINVNSVDLFNLLKNSYEESPYDVFYEKREAVSGTIPYSMDRNLYDILQNGNISSIIGLSNSEIFNIQYVTEYTENGTTYYGDFFKVNLKQRVNGNNLTDFLYEYYNTIDIVDFDSIIARIMDALMNMVKIKANLSIDEVESQTKFDKLLQRILGLCFDGKTEIDVSGNAKLSSIDQIDDSFFEFTPTDNKSIENKVNNIKNGVVEFTDCGNIKFPVNADENLNSVREFRNQQENKKPQKFIEEIEKITNNDEWKKLGLNLDLDVSIKTDIIKQIVRSITFSLLGPKSVLGIMIALKSVKNELADEIESLEDFTKKMDKFLINLVSKLGAIFIEELVKILKKNIRQIVETLLKEIATEARDARLKAISSIVYVLLQVVSFVSDYRSCRSLVDEIQKLLNLASSSVRISLPTFALASSGLLGGFSPTRAFSNVVGEFDKLGIPTGALPDGSPNIALQAISSQIKSVNDEDIANSKVEIFIPPLAVAALGGGTTLPGRGVGKKL